MDALKRNSVALVAVVGVAVLGAACAAEDGDTGDTVNGGDPAVRQTEDADSADTDIDTGEDTSTDLGTETETG